MPILCLEKSKRSPSNEKMIFEHQKVNLYEMQYTIKTFHRLSKNLHHRFKENSPKIGHAVLSFQDSTLFAFQYDIQMQETDDVFDEDNETVECELRPLINIEEVQYFGVKGYRAVTPNGTQMESNRFIDIALRKNSDSDLEEMKLAFFSSSKSDGRPLFYGGGDIHEPINIEKNSDIIVSVKGGKTLNIDPKSVKVRESNPERTQTQNKVMGNISAHHAYQLYFNKNEHKLASKLKRIFLRSINNTLDNRLYRQYAPEWLHAYAHILVPLNQEPQTRANIAAAPAWANTEMSILERVVSWFALYRPKSTQSILPIFKTFKETDIIENIDYSVQICENNKSLKLKQKINPFKENPVFREASDIAQAVLVSYSLLANRTPVLENKIVKKNVLSNMSCSSADKPRDSRIKIYRTRKSNLSSELKSRISMFKKTNSRRNIEELAGYKERKVNVKIINKKGLKIY